MAVRNQNHGNNMMQTAEGAMIEQSNMLQRMRELAVQAMNGTYSSVQRSYLDLEFQALSSQVNDVSTDTTWNDQVLLDDSVGDFIFQAGQASGQTITVTIGGESIDTYANSGDALVAISSALEKINSQRAEIGAGINRMEYAADNLTNVSSNATQSRSTIMDTDYALATTMLAKTQIIQQAATAMLAQANQQPQAVMTLLKG